MQALFGFWPLVVGILAMLLIWWLGQLWYRESYCPYDRRESLLTRNEQRFYRALNAAVDGDWAIFAMVRMADLIRVQPDATQRQAWQNRINGKHIDFVLCDTEDLEPRVAIELDDRSHLRPDRIRRDEFVNDALAAAGLPLVRVTASASYSPRPIRAAILEVAHPSRRRRKRRPAEKRTGERPQKGRRRKRTRSSR